MAANSSNRFEDYVPVAERIEQFYAAHPNGRILTAIIEHDREAGFILMRAEIYREPEDALPSATGHAYELKSEGYVNKTSYIENGETGSVGRALANLNFETKRTGKAPTQSKPQAVPPGDIDSLIRAEIKRVGRKDDAKFQAWINKTWMTATAWAKLPAGTKKEILDSLLSMASSSQIER